METFNEEKLVKYEMGDQDVFVGFANFEDAERYAAQKLGTLVEVGFKDGNDNPQITNEAGLISQKLHFYVDAGPEYRFIHSADPEFREYMDQLQEIESDLKEESPEEKYITDARIEMTEDPLVVLKNGEYESVQTRERVKYRKHAKVYEIGVAFDRA